MNKETKIPPKDIYKLLNELKQKLDARRIESKGSGKGKEGRI